MPRFLVHVLGLIALAWLICGCAKSPKTTGEGVRAAARALFGEQREALPRTDVTIPLPLTGKYWQYSADLEYPDRVALIAELTADLGQASTAEQAIRCTQLRRLGETPPAAIETELLAIATSFVAAAGLPEALPPTEALTPWLLAYFPEGENKALQDWLIGTRMFEGLNTTTSMERTDLSFDEFVVAQRDFRRLQLADALITARQLKPLAMFLRPIATDAANSMAMRMEAARTLFALGETEQRPLLLYLGFGEPGNVPLYGWPTYAFLAEHKDPELYKTLQDQLAAAPEEEHGQYLVHLAQYGNVEDLPVILAWIKQTLPQLPTPKIAPEDEIFPTEQTSWTPDRRVEIQLAQDAQPEDELPSAEPPAAAPTEEDPHAGLTQEDLAGAFGYAVADVDAALRLRLLRHFDAKDVLPLVHEALLKGGPAVRIAAGEVLVTHGDAASLELLPLAWADEQDPMVLAELSHTWLMIDQRLALPPEAPASQK